MIPSRMYLLIAALLTCIALSPARSRAADAPAAARPNIVLIMADDLGYGDVGCYGATKVATPNIDRLATQGMRFTDAHAAAATCTPSRYALLTGQYAWRKKGTGVLPGDASLIIDPAKPTLPGILKQSGYATGCVGKWHLGLGSGKVDWNGDIAPGPLELGFDYSFIVPATGDRVPCVYVEGHRVVGGDPNDPILVNYQHKVGDLPTGREHPELLTVKPSHGHADTIVNGISRIGFMAGGKRALWNDTDMADVLTRTAVQFLEQHKDKPFFLYFATHDIHVPRVPNGRFVGKSGCGVRGDVIQELDWSVGQVTDALKRLGLEDNTLVIFTSDNGPVVDDGYADGAVRDLNGHTPAGPLRGGKYSIFEGGTREPFITRWPGKVQPGTTSEALVCQVDLMHSFAAMAGRELPPDAGPDSFNVLPALLGQSKAGRDALVEQGGGVQTAMRKGQWKFIPQGAAAAPRNGGAQRAAAQAPPSPTPPSPAPPARPASPEVNNGPVIDRPDNAGGPVLYDLANDLAEKKNIAAEHPEVVKELRNLLRQAKEAERTRP